MNASSKDVWIVKLVSLFVLALAINAAVGQKASVSAFEQSQFSMETDVVPILHPIDLPEGALQVLRNDRSILNCSGADKMTADQVPAVWFVASEVHLGGPREIDLVVQGRDLHVKLPPNLCLMGVNIKPFWVFRQTEQGYSLVLSTSAHDLRVLGTRSKGFRDIEASAMTAVTGYSTTYKFDGEKYQVSKTDSKPLG
jgi:hypothetical protein